MNERDEGKPTTGNGAATLRPGPLPLPVRPRTPGWWIKQDGEALAAHAEWERLAEEPLGFEIEPEGESWERYITHPNTVASYAIVDEWCDQWCCRRCAYWASRTGWKGRCVMLDQETRPGSQCEEWTPGPRRTTNADFMPRLHGLETQEFDPF